MSSVKNALDELRRRVSLLENEVAELKAERAPRRSRRDVKTPEDTGDQDGG